MLESKFRIKVFSFYQIVKHFGIYVGNLQCQNLIGGNSLAVQWLRLCVSTAGGSGSIPGRGTKIPHATRCSPPEKKKKKGKLTSPILGQTNIICPFPLSPLLYPEKDTTPLQLYSWYFYQKCVTWI